METWEKILVGAFAGTLLGGYMFGATAIGIGMIVCAGIVAASVLLDSWT